MTYSCRCDLVCLLFPSFLFFFLSCQFLLLSMFIDVANFFLDSEELIRNFSALNFRMSGRQWF